MKARVRLITLIFSLLVSLVLVSTSSYAWFSMNIKVQTSGMNLTTNAPTNMLISGALTSWDVGTTTLTDISGGFSPSSSIDGLTFFALSSSEGLDVKGGIVDSTTTDLQFAKVGRKNETDTFYAEFTLYIKAGNVVSRSDDYQMILEHFTVETTSETNIAKCARVSISEVGRSTGLIKFGDDGKAYTTDEDGNITNTEVTYDANVQDTLLFKYDTETTIQPIASLSNNTYGTANLETDTAKSAGVSDVCFTVDPSATDYTTIIVRIWLEGQHSDCLNVINGETISVTLDWVVKID